MTLPAPAATKELNWQDEDDDLFAVLFPLVQAAARAGAQTALEGLTELGIGVDWGLVNTQVRDWAKRYTYDLVKGINGTSRQFLQQAVSDWIQSGQPIDDLMSQLEPMFGETRATMIAISEVTSAFANGNDLAWLESGVVEECDIETAEDEGVCPICNEKKEQGPWKIGDPEGQPAFHIRCRCWKRPIVKGMA